METAKRQKGPRGSERILYVSDPSSIARKLLPDPVREEDLRNWVEASPSPLRSGPFLGVRFYQ